MEPDATNHLAQTQLPNVRSAGRADHWGLGVAYTALAHLAVGLILALVSGIAASLPRDVGSEFADYALTAAGGWFLGIGLTQCLYLVPLALYLHHTQRPRATAGVLICMGIVFLLSAACFGVFVFGMGGSFR
jgi:hypothetical protein